MEKISSVKANTQMTRFSSAEKVEHFLSRHPLDATRWKRCCKVGIDAAVLHVGVFTNVISIIVGHPISVQWHRSSR